MQQLFGGLDFGQSVTAEYEGFTVVAQMVLDDDATPPWEREDGHGPVREARNAADKRPGEMVLYASGRSVQLYDLAAATEIAWRDQWGIRPGVDFATREYAEQEACKDFDRLKTWCNDDWCYVGVVLEVSRAGVILGGASLWGIESDGGEYLATVAAELLPEAIDAARAKLKELCTC